MVIMAATIVLGTTITLASMNIYQMKTMLYLYILKLIQL